MDVNISTLFTVITCCHDGCGVSFAVTQQHQTTLQQSHDWFYCPNGHRQHYSAKSEAEKLRDQLASTTARLDQERACCREKSTKLEQLGNRLTKTRAGYLGQIARQKKAIGSHDPR